MQSTKTKIQAKHENKNKTGSKDNGSKKERQKCGAKL